MLTLQNLILASILAISRSNAATFSAKGCYSYSDLSSYLTSEGEYTYQTNSYCQQQCSGYAVAATLDGSTCYCGNTLPSSISSVSSSKCDVTCNGYGTEICGGDGYLTVYTTGEEDTSGDSSSSSKASSKSSSSSAASSKSSSAASSAAKSSSTGSSSSSSSSSKSTSTSPSSTISSSSTSTSTSTSASTSNTSASTSSSSSSSQSSTTSSTSQSTTVSNSVVTTIITASNSATTATQTVSATSSTSSSSSSASASSNTSKSSGLSKGAIAGIAIGVVVGVIALIGMILALYCFKRNRDEDDEEDLDEKPPIHNDLFYSQDDRNIFKNPVPYVNDNGHKRLSNGSLPDARHENTLRVTNPDDNDLNDTTLNHMNEVSDSDDDDWRK